MLAVQAKDVPKIQENQARGVCYPLDVHDYSIVKGGSIYLNTPHTKAHTKALIDIRLLIQGGFVN
jgi:hypothetical protein